VVAGAAASVFSAFWAGPRLPVSCSRDLGADELNEGHLGGVADAARGKLVDAGVTAGAPGKLGGLLVKKEGDGILIAHFAQRMAPEVDGVLLLRGGRGLLGLGDDLLDEGTQDPGLRERGLDATMAMSEAARLESMAARCSRVTPRDWRCLR